MKNTVFINKDYLIETVYRGDQTYDTLIEMGNRSAPLLEELRKKNKPLHILIDLSRIGKSNYGSRKGALEVVKKLPFHKMAIYGSNLYIKTLATYMAIATGKKSTMKYFDTKEAAVEWLKKDSYDTKSR